MILNYSKYYELEENTLGRTIAVGDIHGMYNLLMKNLRRINFDFKKDRLICVGDLVDRGEHSLKCANLIDEDWFYCVRGNHEQIQIDDISGCMSRDWFRWLSVDEQKEVQNKFRMLPFAIETVVNDKLIGIVHADTYDDWDDVKLALTDHNAAVNIRKFEEVAMWSRARAKSKETVHKYVKNIDYVIIGHTMMPDGMTVKGNCYFIDTGAVYYGKFCLLDLATMQVL